MVFVSDGSRIPPNVFKRDLGVGEAIMVIPHTKGSKAVRIKFNKLDDLPKVPIEDSLKTFMPLLNHKIVNINQSSEEGNPFNNK